MPDYTPQLGTYKICCVCGKKFYIPAWMADGYTYCFYERYCCSYSCYSKKIDETQPKNRFSKYKQKPKK